MALGQGSYVRSNTGIVDDRAHVTFFRDAVPNEAASMTAGRPIYQDEERIEISFPGNQLNIWVGRVTEEHRQKYARQYEAFLKGEEIAHEGTPIEQMTVLNKAQVKELKYFDIFTVEDAANLSEQGVQAIGMGGARLREMAKKYLEQAQGFAPIAKLVSDNENLLSQLQAQKAQMEEMNRTLMAMQGQLQTYAQAPLPPQMMAPIQQPIQSITPQAALSSLDSIGAEPVKRKPGRPRKQAA
jgi:hypothetical protein